MSRPLKTASSLVRPSDGRLAAVGILGLVFCAFAAAGNPAHVHDPGAKGPFEVGYLTIDALPVRTPLDGLGNDCIQTGRTCNTTDVVIWYPTEVTAGATNPSTPYQVNVQNFFGIGIDQISVSSRLSAVKDAPLAVPVDGSRLKVIILAHSGNFGTTPTDLYKIQHAPVAEVMASHGFVVVGWARPVAAGQELDVDPVIDAALAAPSLTDHVDHERLGIMASGGGQSTIGYKLVGYDSRGILADRDPRFVAGVYVDAGNIHVTNAMQRATSTAPFLLFRGSLHEFDRRRNALGNTMTRREAYDHLFQDSVSASPRYQVRISNYVHRSAASGNCDTLEAMRERSLAIDPLIEPLIVNQEEPPVLNPAGVNAWYFWNVDLGGGDISPNPIGGGVREYCSQVGVDSELLSSDQDGDGLTDTYTNAELNSFVNNPSNQGIPGFPSEFIPNEELISLMRPIQVAFFKVHLQGDERYLPFITSGFGDRDERVEISVLGETQDLQINQGLSGGWFNPATPGQGFVIDIEPESQFMFLAWFTYEADGSGVRWWTAQGNYSDTTATLPLSATSGGLFDDPREVNTVQDGSLTIGFSDCRNAVIDYVLESEGIQGRIPITRLISGTDTLCETLVAKGPAEVSGAKGLGDLNQGFTGAWFNPDTPGQGLLFDVAPTSQFFFAAWFTFSADSEEPGQRWLTAQGTYSGNNFQVPVFATTGGLLDDPRATTTEEIGTLDVNLMSCSDGLLSYDLSSEGLQGEIPITRLIAGTEALCEIGSKGRRQ